MHLYGTFFNLSEQVTPPKNLAFQGKGKKVIYGIPATWQIALVLTDVLEHPRELRFYETNI